MKVLFLSTWFPYPPDNGSKTRACYLLRALARSHQVTAVAFRPPGSESAEQPPCLSESYVQIHPVAADPYAFVKAPTWLRFLSPIPLAYWPSRAMQETLKQVAGSGRWDLVVALQAPVARYAAQLPGAPRVLDVDNALSYQMHERLTKQTDPAGRLRAWTSWQKARHFETRVYRKFDLCMVVSSVEVEHLNAMLSGSCPVELVSNGVDCQRNHPGISPPIPNTLVFNGALGFSSNYYAMQYFLAEVYPLIQQQEPEVSLTITGSTEGADLAGLQLDRGVHLSGYVEDIRPLVARAWACVVPVRHGGGTRIKILEAMALGTPVVATSKGAEGLEVVDGEHLLLADEPTAFAERTVQLLHDPTLHQQLATNARRLVEQRYDWEGVGRRFVELVERVAGWDQ